MHISDGIHASKLAAMYNIDYFELLSYLKNGLQKVFLNPHHFLLNRLQMSDINFPQAIH